MDASQRYLPRYQFAERHGLSMQASPHQVLDAVEGLVGSEDPVFRALMRVREAPARLAARLGARSALAHRAPFGLHEFTRLERRGDELLAYGLVGRFWRPGFGLETVRDADHFRAFDRAGVAKLVLSFSCRPAADGGTELETTTRVYCPDSTSRALFTPYWLLIRPASGLIRRRLLRTIKARTEAARVISG